MSGLAQFLIDNPVDNVTSEVVISERLKNFKFKISAISGQQFSEYQRLASKSGKHGKVDFDSGKFNEIVVLNHTIEPNFRDSENIKKAGCVTPEQFLYKSILSGEIAELAQKISELSGFDADIEELVEEVKNS